ncbi:MAG: hypothetical protein IPO58_06630 [Betaproteobacteria bacterium]|nr:hypothetical protein [Betaproteobacteria bacterium]
MNMRTMNSSGSFDPGGPPARKRASPLRVARIVVWAVRDRSKPRFGSDAPKIEPGPIIGALIGFALIVAAMLWLVSTIVR